MDLMTQRRTPRLSEYDLVIPDELIAQYPNPHRDRCRLMLVNKSTAVIQDRRFNELANFLVSGDVLVLNDTRVFPARLQATKDRTDVKLELLLLRELEQNLWEVLARPARKIRVGNTIILEGGVTGEVIDSTSSGSRIIQFDCPDMEFHEFLDIYGESPLPPYIQRETEPADRHDYQTIFAQNRGAVAAPTAGLHFTQHLLDELLAKGVQVAYLTLHIGIGTFRPIRVEDISRHKMDCEYYAIGTQTTEMINDARKRGSRIVAVGTSVARALESAAELSGQVISSVKWTDKFIYPPYRFRVVEGLVTNFHQPKSTLMLLVSAFIGKSLADECYRRAIDEEYRFFSYGDAMLIL